MQWFEPLLVAGHEREGIGYVIVDHGIGLLEPCNTKRALHEGDREHLTIGESRRAVVASAPSGGSGLGVNEVIESRLR